MARWGAQVKKITPQASKNWRKMQGKSRLVHDQSPGQSYFFYAEKIIGMVLKTPVTMPEKPENIDHPWQILDR